MNMEIMKSVWRRIRKPSQKTLNGLPVKQPEPQWNYKPVVKRAAKLLPLVLALVCSNAFAELGETPAQMESGRPEFSTFNDDGTVSLGWTVRYPALGRRPLRHLGIFRDGVAVSEAFQFSDMHVMSRAECEIMLRPYAAFSRSAIEQMSDRNAVTFNLIGSDGGVFAYVMYNKTQRQLSICKLTPTQPNTTVATTNLVPATKPKNDCVVVATEIRDRMKDKSQWNGILAFKLAVDGNSAPVGHAVACWKYSTDGHVFVSDDDGTIETNTSSTNAADICNALSVSYSATYKHRVLLDGHFLQ